MSGKRHKQKRQDRLSLWDQRYVFIMNDAKARATTFGLKSVCSGLNRYDPVKDNDTIFDCECHKIELSELHNHRIESLRHPFNGSNEQYLRSYALANYKRMLMSRLELYIRVGRIRLTSCPLYTCYTTRSIDFLVV